MTTPGPTHTLTTQRERRRGLPDAAHACDVGSMSTLYDEVGGFDTLLAVCRRWHELCLADPVAAHPFEHVTHPLHDERLAA